MRHNAFPRGVTREGLVDWYLSARARTRELFAIVSPDAWYDRPIPLRNPIVFYEGHLPAFCVNTLIKLAHRQPGVDERLETLFARGIDPEDEASASSPADLWPSRETVASFVAACDDLIVRTLREAPLEDDSVPALRGGEAVLTILEHELMHQETLLYMIHQLPYAQKTRPRSAQLLQAAGGDRQTPGAIDIPAGQATLGGAKGAFGWDNEFPAHVVDVPAFAIDAHSVTNGDYLEYMRSTGAPLPHFWLRRDDEWYWRGMFELLPLPLDGPVYVTQDEASRYAEWKGGRLPTEAEFHRAAYGTPDGDERQHPWGDAAPQPIHGNFDFRAFDPLPAGAHPAGASAWGVHDLVGNGWEWTSSVFDGFAGFVPMASYGPYSIDFFDGAHYVIKGASPVTGAPLIRRSFRNWFRPNYPYVYAKFRCVSVR